MGDAFPSDRKQKREALLDEVDRIAPVLQACGVKNEELGTRSPEAVIALRTTGMVKLEPCTEMGSSEADRVTEMMVPEQLAYLEKVFTDGNGPTAAISFFPAGPAVRDRNGFRVSGRCRFNSGIRHAKWVLGRTVARSVSSERLPDGAAIADVGAICVHATDVAVEPAMRCCQFVRHTGPHSRMSSAVCCASTTSLAFTRR